MRWLAARVGDRWWSVGVGGVVVVVVVVVVMCWAARARAAGLQRWAAVCRGVIGCDGDASDAGLIRTGRP